MTIHAIDRVSVGSIHTMFNASMLLVLEKAFPNHEIIFYSEKEHSDMVSKKIGNSTKVVFRPFHRSLSNGSGVKTIVNFYSKLREDVGFYKKIFSEAKSNDLVFLCSASILSLYLFKKQAVEQQKISTIITLHGELEYVYYYSSIKEKIIGKILRKIFTIKSNKIQYLLLNKISKKKLLESRLFFNNELIEIDHPYILTNHYINNKTEQKRLYPLKIGNVGSLGIRKSGQQLYQLAILLKNYINNGLLEIHSVGAIEKNIYPFRNKFVIDSFSDDNNNSLYISRDEFENKVNELDYAVFFYNHHQFIFRASGAILDVIKFNKPIIALQHPYFEYLFEKAGNIGYMCSTLKEMKELIDDIVTKKSKFAQEYEIQCTNIKLLKDKMSIMTIADDFKNQLNLLMYENEN